MKKIVVNMILLVVAVLMILPMITKSETRYESAVYDSEANMKSSLTEIQTYLRNQYSSTKSSDYKGTATVTTYDSSDIGIVLNNISQTTMNNKWNGSHGKNYKIDGTCGLVALDIMIQKYMTLVTGKLPNTDTNYGVFSKMVEYAFDSGIFPDNGKAYGTTSSEEKKIANYYMDTYQKDKYTANLDTTGLWNTLKSYIDDKVRPVRLALNGTSVNHAVVASAYYVERVTYQQKNVWGNWKTYTKDFKVVRICDGWKDLDSTNWNKTTNSYIFFDCVNDLIKFK